MTPEENRRELLDVCRRHDVAGFGVARLDRVRTDDCLLPEGTLGRFPLAVSVALRVSPDVLATLEGEPNRLYEHHYRQVNFALDRLGLALAGQVNRAGGAALPIPASQIVDWENQRAHLSHKRVAVEAGLGWLGRNNLLVTPRCGAQVRLVTVLTDLSLAPDGSLERDCGDCRRCVDACPACAIKETAAEFDHQACFRMLKDYQRRRIVSQYICGLCVRACPGPG